MVSNKKAPPITVGLFTYHRPVYLQRQLNFFKDLNADFRLIILDGSEDQSYKEQTKNIATQFGHEYFNKVDFRERHLLFFEKLDTEFASWCSDDDLVMPSFFSDGATFLKENSAYAAIAGKVYTLQYASHSPHRGYYLRSHLENKYDILYGDLVEKIVRRDQSYGLGCPPTFYGVKRYSVMQTFNKHITKISLLTSMERLDMICTLMQGGIKVIDTLMGFRDYSSDTTRQAFRDDPVYYISKEDTDQLQNVIREEMKDKIESKEVLEYFSRYAWPLPLRLPQGEKIEFKYHWAEVLESVRNLFFAHYFHDFNVDVTNALRKNIVKYSKNN